MRFPALGEAATQLPWLCPSASSLLALAKPATAWAEVRDDPGAVLLIVRQTARTFRPGARPGFPILLRDPAILQGAGRFLQEGLGPLASAPAASAVSSPRTFVDWSQPGCRSIYDACLLYARTAERLAELSQRADAPSAWVAGFLTPLGWLALCAVDPEGVTACVTDPAFAADPVGTQQQRWGYDQAGIARRLARRWRLPDWLAVLVGHLGLPEEIAHTLGADPGLVAIVQLAVGLVQQRGLGLRLMVGTDPSILATELGLSATELSESVPASLATAAPDAGPGSVMRWTSPDQFPLLPELLRLAADNLQLQDSLTLEHLECARDHLHHALEKQRQGEAERLKALKLNALAEFAAGAAHEINNPLAVISGQAQYLLGREVEPYRQRALQTITGQAHRIHQLLNELMQFARPPRPHKQTVDLRGLVREVALSLSDLAAQRQVQLVCPDPDPVLSLVADPRLLRTALECLLRNAIEAAPLGGWAGIRVQPVADERLEFVVEDSGPGPAPSQRDQLFDPFYSGRLAGRGRGFGLPTAWRLARQHGGDVRLDRAEEGPTRFILTLPRASAEEPLPREPGAFASSYPLPPLGRQAG